MLILNRNTEAYFSELPKVEVQRSIFDRSSGNMLTGNVGDLIPIYWDTVLPGDTFKMRTSCVLRLQTLLSPVMGNLYADVYHFFVPMRLTWNGTKEFFGENTQGAWFPQTEKIMPILKYPTTGFEIGTIADYMGIPVGVGSVLSNGAPRPDSEFPISLPFRAYALICNEWFRNQNLTDPLQIPMGDATQDGSNGDNYITDVANGGKPFKVSKYKDYFSSCLPSPQKGYSVELSLGPDAKGVVTTSDTDYTGLGIPATSATKQPIFFGVANESATARSGQVTTSGNFIAQTSVSGTDKPLYPVNLIASMDGVGMVSVNELRLAFQLQKFYEKNARGGTRMREYIHEHFGVVSPDARMQIPEYLGGHRFPIQIHQVANTSQGEQAFLGDLGAMSNTADTHDDFIFSSTEPGYIISVMCLRYNHCYSQGLSRDWSRRRLIDHYHPVFSAIGEQPVFLREIYANSDDSHEVFGYNEAWAEYRYRPSTQCGEFRPGHNLTLDSWHFGDFYNSRPYLSDEWIREDKTNVDRTLAVTSQVAHQFFADFWFDCQVTRPMPVHSIPGLIDHF